MRELSSFLFARPSFLEGVARVLDLGGTLQEYNSSITPQQADALALNADWRAVNEEFARAMFQVSSESRISLTSDLLMQAQSALDSSSRLEPCLPNGK